jgi:hypothetical protein
MVNARSCLKGVVVVGEKGKDNIRRIMVTGMAKIDVRSSTLWNDTLRGKRTTQFNWELHFEDGIHVRIHYTGVSTNDKANDYT